MHGGGGDSGVEGDSAPIDSGAAQAAQAPPDSMGSGFGGGDIADTGGGIGGDIGGGAPFGGPGLGGRGAGDAGFDAVPPELQAPPQYQPFATAQAGEWGNIAEPAVNTPANQASGPQGYTRFEERSIDGRGNNPFDNDLGQAGTPFTRLLEPDYADGQSAPAGEDRPSPREISNAVVDQGGLSGNPQGLSNLFWQWGQFLDHDYAVAPENSAQELPIQVPRGDTTFDPQGTGEAEIPFERSEATADANGVAQQTNELTHFIDGSQVYGADQERADRLRSFEDGKLRLTEDGLLPDEADEGFLAGDARVAEQPGLTALHTVFAREHNRVADRIKAENPQLNDEQIYQAARREVSGVLQAITYREFVPALLGDDALAPYQGFDPNTDPRVSNAFTASAFRFGHSLVTPDLERLNANGQSLEGGPLSLRDAFEDPSHIKNDGIEPYIRGQAATQAQELDNRVADDLRNLLFGPPGSDGRDLAALNIQRGRDHGLPSLNDAREQLGLRRIESFNDPVFRDGVGEKLASVYDSPDDIDLWVGGLSERPSAEGGIVGDTNRAILADQFTRSRDGDRFFYLNEFKGEELNRIHNTTLADVIERNTDINNLQDRALFVPERQ